MTQPLMYIQITANLLGEALMETRQKLRAEVPDPEKFIQKDFEGFYGYYFIKNIRREKDITISGLDNIDVL